MLVKEVAEKLGLKILASGNDQEVTSGYVSDLLSDVIANAEEGCLWITVPEAAVLARAGQEGLFVLSGAADSFTLAGKLYALISPSE
jgi:hypothetical protein